MTNVEIIISVGGVEALARSLRALSTDPNSGANPLRRRLSRASRLATRYAVREFRRTVPVGNYRAGPAKQNTRKVYIGDNKGRQQRAGGLKRSIKGRQRHGNRFVIMGGGGAHYVYAVIAGHKLPNSDYYVHSNDWLWDLRAPVSAESQRIYTREINAVAKEFRQKFGQVRYTTPPRGRR